MNRHADVNQKWLTVADLIALQCQALPTDARALGRYIERHGWREDADRARFVASRGRGGGTWQYHYSLLPSEAQAKWVARQWQNEATTTAHEAWRSYAALPEKARKKAAERLAVVAQVADLQAGGMQASLAVGLVSTRAKVAASTIWNWLRLVEGLPRPDWEPALAPRHVGRTATTPCHPQAWDFLCADYLRPEQPSFVACYRRLTDAAAVHGWTPIPAEKTLRRRIEREVPRGARTIARQGRDLAQAIFPHQTRDRSAYAAMEAVNADGHRFDVFVRWPDGEIGRPMMVAIQDLHSGMIVGHRLDRTESWPLVRAAFADMMESFGIPEHAYLDNGRGFASKFLTGRMKTRFRFKVRPDEPEGLLTRLGVKVHWTTPYHGQAKPIERAFRDLCEEIAKHPTCAGAYTGNSPMAKPSNYASKAVPIEAFRALVASEVARHNARTGRRSRVAQGGSFADAFRSSLDAPGTMVTKAAPEQLRMFLMAAEGVTCRKPTGEIHLADNRYWAEPLVELTGRKVVVRFDPQDLLRPVAVYALDGRFVCEAECIEATGFDDIEAARDHAKRRRQWLAMQRELLDLERRLSIDEVARLLPSSTPQPEQVAARVVRLAATGTDGASPQDPHEEAEENFGRAMRAIAAGGGDVLAFPGSRTGEAPEND